jgi:hypothetical protein
MDAYVMMETSYESDDQFLDNMAEESLTNPDYMTEEDHEEEEVVLYEATEDELVDNAFNSLFNVPKATSKSLRRAKKKTRRENAPKVSLWVGKWDELGHKWGAKVTRGTK